MYLQNRKKLTNLLNEAKGNNLANSETAKDILSFFPESDYKEIKNAIFSNKGIIYSQLVF